jgi:hypothetical protein
MDTGDDIEAYLLCNDEVPQAELKAEFYSRLNIEEKYWMPLFARHRNQWPSGTLLFLSLSFSISFSIFARILMSSGLASFRNSLKAYWSAAERTAADILSALSLSLSLPTSQLPDLHSKFDCTLELKRYPPQRTASPAASAARRAPSPSVSAPLPDDDRVRVKSHVDLSTITLLVQDDVDGLEVH